MSVTGVYGNDAMLRQIAESVRINRVAKGSLINTKKEWNYIKLPRVALDEGECETPYVRPYIKSVDWPRHLVHHTLGTRVS